MATFNGSIQANTDDGQTVDGSYWSANSVWVGLEGGSFAQHDAYLRFDNVTIPYGATISSATITLTAKQTNSATIRERIKAIDEDDTATFSSNPSGRSKTTASTNWTIPSRTLNSTVTTANFSSSVKTVVDRANWSSGNALGIVIEDTFTDTALANFYDYNDDTAKVATISITYTTPDSPSPSLSPSASISKSPSSSQSPSASFSRSPSLSESASTSPSPGIPFHGIKVAKPGVDAIETNNPTQLIFDSDYGTLKYFDKQELNVSFNIGSDVTGKASYTHDLGYYPYVEVFVSVNGGAYEYCPFAGAGATILYNAVYKLTTSDITVYGDVIGMGSITFTFKFLIFIYKNNLQLS